MGAGFDMERNDTAKKIVRADPHNPQSLQRGKEVPTASFPMMPRRRSSIFSVTSSYTSTTWAFASSVLRTRCRRGSIAQGAVGAHRGVVPAMFLEQHAGI